LGKLIDVDQGNRSCDLLRLREFRRTTMNMLAVLDNTNQKTSRSAIRTGKLVVNLDTRIVSVDDRAVRLSGKEYGLLELLNRPRPGDRRKSLHRDGMGPRLSFGTRLSPVGRPQPAGKISTGAGQEMSE
jgi:hypothetical protein